MLNKKIAVAIAVFVAIICLAEARNDDNPHDMESALRMLQDLDRFYTQAARPRYVFYGNYNKALFSSYLDLLLYQLSRYTWYMDYDWKMYSSMQWNRA